MILMTLTTCRGCSSTMRPAESDHAALKAGLRDTKCCVSTCTNHTAMMQDGVLSFHRFPRNHELKAKWMKVIGRKQWPSKWWTAVCSDHFAPEDFVSGHAALGMLKPKAVPSVFWDKGSPVVTQARRAPRKLPAGSSRIQTIDTASPHGEETNAPESSALAEASTFIVVALNSPTTSADVPSTPVRTSGNDSSHHDVAATAHQTTSGEQPKGLAMTGPTLPHESAPNLGVQDVAECGRQQKVLMVRTATSDERESSTLQVMEPEPQTGAAEKPAAAPEAHQSGAQQADGQLVTAPTTPAGAQQVVTAPTSPTKAQPCNPAVTALSSPASAQKLMTPPTTPASSRQPVTAPTPASVPQLGAPRLTPACSRQPVTVPTPTKAQQLVTAPTTPASSRQPVTVPTPTKAQQLVTAPTTTASSRQPVTAPTPASSAQQPVTAPTTPASTKSPELQRRELANKISDAGAESNHQPSENASEGVCDVCQRTFQRKDLTKIFVEIRKRLVGKYPQGQCSPFMLCAECKEPLLQAAATSDTSAGSTSKTQRKDIVAKLRERALNSQVTTWTSDEVVSVDFEQPAESPSSAPVQDKPVGTSSPSAVSVGNRSVANKQLTNSDGAVLKCCVPSCTNRSDEPRHQPLAFYRFPRSVALKKQWAEAMGRTGWLPLQTTVMCSDHFRPSDLTNGCPLSGVPKPKAVPSIFEGKTSAEITLESDERTPGEQSVPSDRSGWKMVSLLPENTATRGRGRGRGRCSSETSNKSTGTRGAAVKRILSKASPPIIEKKRKKASPPLTFKDIMEVDTSSFWLKTLSNRMVNFVHIVHRPMPCITRSVTVSPDMSVMVAVENARLSLLPCGTPVPYKVDSVETLQGLLQRVEKLDDSARNDNWQLRKQSTLKLVGHLLQEVCREVGNADCQIGVLSSIRDQVNELL
ncbi:mucin-5AC isoform X6 [Dermacentor silvarum]|uniref:mucin-5AC isoform X5 n=1 Tax=Dermacentor silvarum TaxID=543639 RepID=UPI002100785C|nr:mucin-5AC isoform X5 [Dermacentor silvarum]XP_049526699.1 mucin-5AC isoform X6 [Dermacentor silvarum]